MRQLTETVKALREQADRLETLAEGPQIVHPDDIRIREAVRRLNLLPVAPYEVCQALKCDTNGKFRLRFNVTTNVGEYTFGDTLVEVIEKVEARHDVRPAPAVDEDALNQFDDFTTDLATPDLSDL